MKKQQNNPCFVIAAILFSLRNILTYLIPLPESVRELISGLLIGMSIVALIYGYIPKEKRLRFRNYKRALFLGRK